MAKTSINSVQVKKMNFNGNKVNKAYLNGVLVFSADVKVKYTIALKTDGIYDYYRTYIEFIETPPEGDTVTCDVYVQDSSYSRGTITIDSSTLYGSVEYQDYLRSLTYPSGSPSKLVFKYGNTTVTRGFTVVYAYQSYPEQTTWLGIEADTVTLANS